MKKRKFVPKIKRVNNFDGIRIYCDGEYHYICIKCMGVWELTEVIDCPCMKKGLLLR